MGEKLPWLQALNSLLDDSSRYFAKSAELYLADRTTATRRHTVPHDHGSSWAIVTGVEGRETHRLYKRVDGNKGPGTATLEKVGELTISDGESISMLVGGIHAIEAVGEERSMMLHCYGKGFDHQTDRLEFDETSGTCAHSVDAAGVIQSFPLHPDAL